jgi:hypothetical protein
MTTSVFGVQFPNPKKPRREIAKAEQLQFVVYLDGMQAKVSKLRDLHDATVRELDALLPSVLDQPGRVGRRIPD